MLNAFLLGAVAQVSLVLAGLVVFRLKVPTKIVGALAGFGAGSLIGAIAFDLAPDAKGLTSLEAAGWLLIGALVFAVGDHLVEKRFGSEGTGSALGIVVGSVVDGVPESVIFGVQLAAGMAVSAAFLFAVFVSNIPQALAPSASLAESGWSWKRVGLLWFWVVLACGVASALGYGVSNLVTDVTGARIAALAGGGILAMLSDSLLPFAHEHYQNAGIWTVVGLCVSLAMS